MRYGFVLDQSRCIGCHACTVACKSENEVPLGSFRTWVKYVEKGEFPETRRHFAVLRCNQCDRAPCIAICPTNALFRRPDGIVDFDRDACIGCKSCMQACPYDALYVDPATNTAAKCHYCAHRVDRGLEPACVVVCPTQAIVPGDLDDPQSRIAKIVASQPVTVRKPERETRPKVFYVGAEEAALAPSIGRQEAEFLFSETVRKMPELADPDAHVREVYDVPHDAPWGWRVWTYLWTKSVAAGAILVAAILGFVHQDDRLLGAFAGAVAVLFTVVTTLLLILDLKRPGRFWYLLARPNWRSWLVWGGLILGAFGAFSAAWTFVRAAWMAWPGIALAAAAAGYTAFLFRQCEGRAFWRGLLLLPHLLAEAFVCGSATLLLGGLALGAPADLLRGAATCLGAGCAALAILTLVELAPPHADPDARKAAGLVLGKPWGAGFYFVTIGLGAVVPLACIALHDASRGGAPPAIASIAALVGAFDYGRLWIKAGQAIPLS